MSKTYNLGTCPVVVSDKETAKQAGQWAERMAKGLILQQASDQKVLDAYYGNKETSND